MKVPKETNLDEVKSMAIAFLYTPLHKTDLGPFFIQHPFLDSAVTMRNDGENVELINYFENEDVLQETLLKIKNMILEANDLYAVWNMILTKYHMTFLKYIKPFLCKKDFSLLLADAWTQSENPNQDANVTTKMAAAWFRSADKRYLMNDKEFQVWTSLPDTLTIYRGVAIGHNPKGLSWTQNYDTAAWFATRFDRGTVKGYIEKAIIPKELVLAYFNSREEDEIVADPTKFHFEKIQY